MQRLRNPFRREPSEPLTVTITIDTTQFDAALRRLSEHLGHLGAVSKNAGAAVAELRRAHALARHREFPLLYGRPE